MENSAISPEIQKLSRRQINKQIKLQKKLENSEKWKMAKRQRQKDNKKNKIKVPKPKIVKSISNLQIVLDADYAEFMTEKEISCTSRQFARCYSINRSAAITSTLHITSLHSTIKKSFEESCRDFPRWDIKLHELHFKSVFEIEKCIYLSADSPNVLETIDHDSVYIIGAIVDHNRHKNLCLERATSLGMKHAQLPISKYVDMKTRKVLAINHVFEIIVRYAETSSWETALQVIPMRKFKDPNAKKVVLGINEEEDKVQEQDDDHVSQDEDDTEAHIQEDLLEEI